MCPYVYGDSRFVKANLADAGFHAALNGDHPANRGGITGDRFGFREIFKEDRTYVSAACLPRRHVSSRFRTAAGYWNQE